MKADNQDRLKAVIVDDEDLARKGLAMRLEAFSNVEVVEEACNAREALKAVSAHEPDLVFLDIQMPGMTGLELLSEIQADLMPMIIFVTAFDTFAVEAFKVHAIDYLLKPVEVDRLAEAISRAVRLKQGLSVSQEKQKLLELAVSLTGKSYSAVGELINNSESAGYSDRLAIKDGSSTTFVPFGALGFIIFCLSLITLLAPVPSINIGQGSPPKFKVVDISQLGLSLCLCRQSPFLYALA